MYNFLCGHMFAFLLRIYLGMELLDRLLGNSMFNLLKNCQTIFQNACTILYSHQQCIGFQVLYTLTNTCYYLFFHYSHPMT